jgi:hypothetical protein
MGTCRSVWIVVSIYHMPLALSNMAGCVVDWNGGQAVAGGVAVWSFKFKCKGCAVYKIDWKAFHRCLGARRCLCVVSLDAEMARASHTEGLANSEHHYP